MLLRQWVVDDNLVILSTELIMQIVHCKEFVIIYHIYLNTWHLGVPKFSFKRVRVLEIHPTQPRGGHPSHSNLVRGKLTSPTPNPAGDGTSGLTSYPRRRSKVSEATCLRPQRSAPSRTWTRAVQPRVQRSDHWATHASRKLAFQALALRQSVWRKAKAQTSALEIFYSG